MNLILGHDVHTTLALLGQTINFRMEKYHAAHF
jgi:hypothetical protein